VSLGTASSGADRLFLSAINPSILTFSFRANDKGGSVVAANGIKLTIDGQVVTTTVAPKNADATDVTYTRATPFAAGEHTYKIEVKDTQGNTVTDSGTFTASQVAVLTAAHQAVSVDKTKAGFIWRIVQNEAMTSKSLDDVELALLGTLKDEAGTVIDNLANENEPGNALAAGVRDGKTVKFEIGTVLNLNAVAGNNGGTFTPDEGMPGVPGTSGTDIGIAAEITTFIELPAGVVTLAIACDDRFRAQGGPIGKPTDGILLAEGGLELNGNTATGLTRFFVQDAGIYPVRILFQDNGGAAHIELASVKANGDKVLVNDLENGGFKAYRAGIAPVKSTNVADVFPTIITQPVSQTVAPGANVTFSVSASGGALSYQWQRLATVWTDIPGANTAALTLNGVTATNGVQYRVRVSNLVNSVNSVAANLSIQAGNTGGGNELVVSNDIELGKGTYSAVLAPKLIVLDGKLNEWGAVPSLSDPKFSVPKGSGVTGTGRYVLFEEYGGGTWSGPDDHTSAVQVVYDADHVYFGFVVTDDYHENAAKSAWNGDSIQLMIASGDRQQQVALYNYALGGVDGDLADVIVNHEAGPGGTEAIVTRDTAAKKTYYEIKLPAAAIGKTAPLTQGTQFGLGMAINDGDNGAGQSGQKGWSGRQVS
jgi:hypothetical protein